MFGCKGIARVVGGKLLAGVEEHLERGEVRLQDHVGRDDLVLQLRMRSHQARILVAAHVVPGPAVEAVFLHAGDVVGNEVVAQVVTLVGRAPELAGGRVDGLADAVANTARRRPSGTCPRG